MKFFFLLILLFGSAQLAGANSVAEGALLGRGARLTFGSIYDSFGFLGALCFAGAVASRLKRRNR